MPTDSTLLLRSIERMQTQDQGDERALWELAQQAVERGDNAVALSFILSAFDTERKDCGDQ